MSRKLGITVEPITNGEILACLERRLLPRVADTKLEEFLRRLALDLREKIAQGDG